jgi:hypothetical protein
LQNRIKMKLVLLALLLAGCNGGGGQVASNGSSPSQSSQSQPGVLPLNPPDLSSLNSIVGNTSIVTTGTFQLHFTNLDEVNPLSFGMTPPCTTPICTAGVVFLTESILGGWGDLSGPALGSVAISPLRFEVLLNEWGFGDNESCVGMAADAATNGLQFYINGTLEMFPITYGGVAGGGTGTVAAGYFSGAPMYGTTTAPTALQTFLSPGAANLTPNAVAAVNLLLQTSAVQQGSLSIPQFNDPWVGAVITSIGTCSEGDAVLPPPPLGPVL